MIHDDHTVCLNYKMIMVVPDLHSFCCDENIGAWLKFKNDQHDRDLLSFTTLQHSYHTDKLLGSCLKSVHDNASIKGRLDNHPTWVGFCVNREFSLLILNSKVWL